MFHKLWSARLSSLQSLLTGFLGNYNISTLALVAPLALALVLQIPENPTSGGQTDITWINEPNDPYAHLKVL